MISSANRQKVRERAAYRCEYCRKPESISLYSHHVDHIIPIMHGGNSELENLAWACFQCNVAKGTNIASYDEISGELTKLYNPRTQIWNEHFELIEEVLIGKTSEGRVTIRILQMNHPDQLQTRQELIKVGKWE